MCSLSSEISGNLMMKLQILGLIPGITFVSMILNIIVYLSDLTINYALLSLYKDYPYLTIVISFDSFSIDSF
jgi:hypothetical protein